MSETKQLPVISAQDVNKIFNLKEENEVIALQDVNFQAQQGEFISLIGPSGCGKSTLLRLIANLISPTSGDLKINGKSPAQGTS